MWSKQKFVNLSPPHGESKPGSTDKSKVSKSLTVKNELITNRMWRRINNRLFPTIPYNLRILTIMSTQRELFFWNISNFSWIQIWKDFYWTTQILRRNLEHDEECRKMILPVISFDLHNYFDGSNESSHFNLHYFQIFFHVVWQRNLTLIYTIFRYVVCS